ncbi:RNA-binding domain-containing protein [Photobacterium lipolyticum]|uniref:Type I restriction endonuclease subunit R n=1 Tax=Photobacterium lipolyticum TaxID=266810 RepID=A0A2T3MTC7_9GAMM|nr:RNA-binding domain-containing protein [Photobacterium lipolyticum]PSW02563.1 type I restriction endonuclease subunit R [Photobacterium lipolyticum]
MKKHTEDRLEDAIEYHLVENDKYIKGDSADYDTGMALEPKRFIEFIKETQSKTWQALEKIHGDNTAAMVLADLTKHLETQGMLNVLRYGFKCYGKKLKTAYFLPNNNLNEDTLALYNQNVLSVTRQLYFSSDNTKSIDLVIFLNGLPVITIELKNPLSGQTVEDAKKQYRDDREPNEKLFQFKTRALVHFALDQDLAFMTTHLSGKKTFFLPFNLGFNEGAGNPPAKDGGYRTAYLWRNVLKSDSLLDILSKFMHLQVEEKKILKDGVIKKVKKETMIFPRYHQLDVVRNLISHSKEHGAGKNYLVQHSAGSGKSNSIAWLAHRLSSLHDQDDEKIFHSIVVVTDRKVLDQQLQDTIYQFDHKQGVVVKIDEDTRQLVKALASGTPIIITTVQKFPFVTETIEKLKEEEGEDSIHLDTTGKRFAVIVDEAHSSQSGETAMDMKYVLNKQGIEEKATEYIAEHGEDDEEDEVIRTMLRRGKQENISFYAFTATPKYKTKKIFDEPGKNGKSPFHNYTMRQAIEEKFILDVLASYTTYETYFKITQTAEDDKHVERKKAARALARFLTLHAHNISQKTEVMVEHFRTHVKHKIGGRAKAMVVTDSRLHAVRYKQAFDKYINDKGYDDVKSLVAFSGTVDDPDAPGKSYTEVAMNNGIPEKQLPEEFSTNEYQVLLVAEKYQTGFDQPFLHTMYVDKKLSGIQAVQTLSRLNRMAAGKEDTFVLDFRNKQEEIYKAFKPFYKVTEAEELTDPHHLYRLQGQIEEFQIIFTLEINDFCKVYFAPKRKESVHDHAKMNGILDLAIERYKELAEEEQAEFKSLLVNFRNMYSFLSQVMPYQDSDLERLYTYLRFLLTKLPRDASGPGYKLDEDVELEYYRLQKISEGSINLEPGSADPLKGASEVGTGKTTEEDIALSELIKILNDRFGTEFTEADQLFFDQIEAEANADEDLKQAAQANSMSDFESIFEKAFEGLVIDRMDGNEDIFTRLMGDAEFRTMASKNLMKKVYKKLSSSNTSEEDQIKLLILDGESKLLEFKQTFSMDVKKQSQESHIEKSALKTIVGFLNSEGGNLLIGVNDGTVLGVDTEVRKFFKNNDKYLLNIKNNLKAKIGRDFYPLIDPTIITVDRKSVLRVNCTASNTPCFLEDKEFYVRNGLSNDLLEGKALHNYITEHF